MSANDVDSAGLGAMPSQPLVPEAVEIEPDAPVDALDQAKPVELQGMASRFEDVVSGQFVLRRRQFLITPLPWRLRLLDGDTRLQAGDSGHVHQAFQGEKIDLAAHQIRDAGLGYAE